MPQHDELARLRDLQARCEADFRAIATQYPELCTAVAQRRFYGYICPQTHTQGGYMPSKGYRTMGEELENVAMRLPMSVVAQVDAHIDTLRKGAPWAKVGRSDALRDLVVRGLQSLSPSQPTPPIQPQPAQVPLTTQPALPIALEGVPASERVQPPAPVLVVEPQAAHKSKTPSSRRKDGKGGNPGLPDEKLQQIADTAAQYDQLSFAELSQLLFERGIHRATDSTTGEEKPVNPGTLKRQLDRAREQGMLQPTSASAG